MLVTINLTEHQADVLNLATEDPAQFLLCSGLEMAKQVLLIRLEALKTMENSQVAVKAIEGAINNLLAINETEGSAD